MFTVPFLARTGIIACLLAFIMMIIDHIIVKQYDDTIPSNAEIWACMFYSLIEGLACLIGVLSLIGMFIVAFIG